MTGFYQTYVDISDTIEHAFKQRRLVPGLILLYSTIDGFSYLANKNNESDGDIFKEWVQDWMLTKYPLPCSKEDIWSARCGLLHKQRSMSDKTINGEAKKIEYVFGDYNADKMQFIWNKVIPGKVVVVAIEDMLKSFRGGIKDCLEAIKKDEEWLKSFEEKAAELFLIKFNKK